MNSLKFFYNASKPVLELLTSTELFLTFFGIYFKCKRSLFQCAYYRSYEIIIANYFCVCQKNRRKHNQHFKPPFFKINLRFSTPDYIATYGKLNLLSTNGMFLFFPSREMQGRLSRSKYTPSFSYLVSKEAYHKPLIVAASKKSFPSVFIIDTTGSDECFSFHVITANSIFYTDLSLPRGLVQPLCCCVLSNKCFERSPHFISIISTIILR